MRSESIAIFEFKKKPYDESKDKNIKLLQQFYLL
jgi:hypothetical protein